MKRVVGLEQFESLKETPVTAAYTTSITVSRQVKDRWVSGLPFTLGYTWPRAEPNPLPIIRLNNVDCTYGAALTMKGDLLVVKIDQSEVVDLLDSTMYVVASATMSPSGQEFDGEVSSRVDDKAGTPPYGWKGTAVPGPTAARDNAIAVILAITSWRQEHGLC